MNKDLIKNDEIPMTIDSCQIELNSQCNALCKFCPREEILKEDPYLDITDNRNINIQMHFDEYKKIIDQGKENGLSRVHFTGFGEMTTWKWFKKAFDYCGEVGIQDVHLTTNAFVLNDKKSEIILRNCSSVSISITGTTDEVYNNYQGYKVKYKLNDVEKNLINFVNLRNKQKKTTKINLGFIMGDDSIPQWRKYYDKWVNIVDEIVFADLQEYHLEKYGLNNNNIRNCSEIVNRNKLNFLSNGNVTVCCEDFNGVLSLGNMGENTLSEIWQSPKLKKIKKDFIELDYDKIPKNCQNCYQINRRMNFMNNSHVDSLDNLVYK